MATWPKWATPRRDPTPDDKLGAWCWSWLAWRSWWERGPGVADSRKEEERIIAHVPIISAWTARRPHDVGQIWPAWWSVCGVKVMPAAPNRRYVFRCRACRSVVGNDWWGPNGQRHKLVATPDLRRRQQADWARKHRAKARAEAGRST